MHHLTLHPDTWDAMSWSCNTCGATNPGSRVFCTRAACQADMERGRDTTLRVVLAKMEEELLLLPVANPNTARILTIHMAMSTILSPHHRTMLGLLEESFLTPIDPHTCACTAALGFDTSTSVTPMDTEWPVELCSTSSYPPGSPPPTNTTPIAEAMELDEEQECKDTLEASLSLCTNGILSMMDETSPPTQKPTILVTGSPRMEEDQGSIEEDENSHQSTLQPSTLDWNEMVELEEATPPLIPVPVTFRSTDVRLRSRSRSSTSTGTSTTTSTTTRTSSSTSTSSSTHTSPSSATQPPPVTTEPEPASSSPPVTTVTPPSSLATPTIPAPDHTPRARRSLLTTPRVAMPHHTRSITLPPAQTLTNTRRVLLTDPPPPLIQVQLSSMTARRQGELSSLQTKDEDKVAIKIKDEDKVTLQAQNTLHSLKHTRSHSPSCDVLVVHQPEVWSCKPPLTPQKILRLLWPSKRLFLITQCGGNPTYLPSIATTPFFVSVICFEVW